MISQQKMAEKLLQFLNHLFLNLFSFILHQHFAKTSACYRFPWQPRIKPCCGTIWLTCIMAKWQRVWSFLLFWCIWWKLMKIWGGILCLMFAIAPSAFPNQSKPLVHSRTTFWKSWIQISSKSAHIFYGFDTETIVTIISIQMLCKPMFGMK